jgi:hypothetical protein
VHRHHAGVRMRRAGSRRSRTASACEFTPRAGHPHVTVAHRWRGIHVRRTAVAMCRGLAEVSRVVQHLHNPRGIHRTSPMRATLHSVVRRARACATVTATCRREPVGRHGGGNRAATRHPAPTARPVEATRPNLAETRRGPPWTAHSYDCHGVLVLKPSAACIRSSARFSSQTGGVVPVERAMRRLASQRPGWRDPCHRVACQRHLDITIGRGMPRGRT